MRHGGSLLVYLDVVKLDGPWAVLTRETALNATQRALIRLKLGFDALSPFLDLLALLLAVGLVVVTVVLPVVGSAFIAVLVRQTKSPQALDRASGDAERASMTS